MSAFDRTMTRTTPGVAEICRHAGVDVEERSQIEARWEAPKWNMRDLFNLTDRDLRGETPKPARATSTPVTVAVFFAPRWAVFVVDRMCVEGGSETMLAAGANVVRRALLLRTEVEREAFMAVVTLATLPWKEANTFLREHGLPADGTV